MKGPVLIVGATSAMARAAAHALAATGHPLMLASRDEEECGRLAADLSLRYGIKACSGHFDAGQTYTHASLLERTLEKLGGLEFVLSAVGDLGECPATLDPVEANHLFLVNFTGPAGFLGLCASHLEGQGHGCILGITSVAGDRGRQSNFVYGAAKGAMALYLQGLRNRLHPMGVRVVTFKPGFVDTAMTFGKPRMFLLASAEAAGRALAKALEGGPDLVYFPWFWKWIMVLIRTIPERIFKKMKL